jgi:drug/metabolite transporter (DMT)-like permease
MLSIVLAGIGPILVRDSPVGPVGSAFWRMALAAPVLFLLIRRSALLPWRAMLAAAIAGLTLAGDLVLWNLSLVRTTILEANILVMLYPFVVAPVGYLLFGEKISWRLVLGGGLAFLGLLLMVAPVGASAGGSPGESGHSRLAGDLLAVGAALFYAVSLLISARLCRVHNTFAISFWTLFWGALAALPFAAKEGAFVPVTAANWLYIGFYAELALASYSLFNFTLKTIPAALAGILGYAQPVVATALAFLILHETPSWTGILGSLVIAGGLVVATRAPQGSGKPVAAK